MINVTRNESDLDRLLRLIAGISLIFLALLNTSLDSIIRILFLLFAGSLIFTSLTGFCGLYRLLGISTCSVKSKSSKKRTK